MSARHRFRVVGWVPLALIAAVACHRTPEPSPDDTKKSVASAAPVASDSAPAPSGSALSFRQRLEIGEDTPPPRPPSDNAKQISASHILIAYQGALNAAPTVTRSKDEARALAQRVQLLARAGEDFGDLALKYSDDPGVHENHGDLGKITRVQMDKPFTDAAFNLIKMEVGMDPLETPAGFEIIRRTE
jgi:hypothetical protein